MFWVFGIKGGSQNLNNEEGQEWLKSVKNGAPAPSLSVGWSDGDQDIIDFLDSTTRATGLSKTTLVKNALRVYAQRVKEDGKITVLLPENLLTAN